MCKGGIIILMDFVNTMHHNQKLTPETDDETCGVSFVNVRVNHVGSKIKSSWYTKKTDTGVVLNYNCQSPAIYISGIVSSFVQSIYNIGSTWSNLHQGLKNAQAILRDNQYTHSSIEKEPVLPWIGGSEIVKTAKDDYSQKTISTRLML